MNWKEELTQALADNGETWADIEANTMSEEDMAKSNSLPGRGGCAFTVWTAKRVYFPVIYDSNEWVGSVSRHPNGRPTEHQGGG